MVSIRQLSGTVTLDKTYTSTGSTTVELTGVSSDLFLLRFSYTGPSSSTPDWPGRSISSKSYESNTQYNYFDNGVEFGSNVTINYWPINSPDGTVVFRPSEANFDGVLLTSQIGPALFVTVDTDVILDNGVDYDLEIGTDFQGMPDKPFAIALPSSITSDSDFTQFFLGVPSYLLWDGSGFRFCRDLDTSSSSSLTTEPIFARNRVMDVRKSNYPRGTPSHTAINSAYSASCPDPTTNGSPFVTAPIGTLSPPIFAQATVDVGESATLYCVAVTDGGYSKSSYPLQFQFFNGDGDYHTLYLGPNGYADDSGDEQDALPSTTYLLIYWVEGTGIQNWGAGISGLPDDYARYITTAPNDVGTIQDEWNGVMCLGTTPALDQDGLD